MLLGKAANFARKNKAKKSRFGIIKAAFKSFNTNKNTPKYLHDPTQLIGPPNEGIIII